MPDASIIDVPGSTVDLPLGRILIGDARQMLDALPTQSVDCVVTSPPYFRLRNYGADQQIGLESSVELWVDELRLIARVLARVLKPSGTLWLNLGDSYARSSGDGAPGKSLLLGPERLALALVEDGWILRNKIVWAKPNPMPSSVRDRLSCTWEVVYCFARSRSYFYDLDAIRVPHRSGGKRRPDDASPGVSTPAPKQPAWSVPPEWRAPLTGSNSGLDRLKASGLPGHPLGKNPGDVWSIPTAGYRGAHHAVYPEALVERILTVGCPEKICSGCGAPWERALHRSDAVGRVAVLGALQPNCPCPAAVGGRPAIVLDPFMGSGTTAVVAERLGRDWIGVELNAEFARAAEQRIGDARPERTDSDRGGRSAVGPTERRAA